MAEIIQFRRGSAAYWTAVNPVLAQGELGYEIDTLKVKLGDGVTAWNDLAYWGGAESLFLGTYVDLGALTTAHPAPVEGSKANIDAGVGSDVMNALWDNNDDKWVLGGVVAGMQSEMEAATAKPAPDDADVFARLDSTDSNKLVKWLWSDIKAALVAFLDARYRPLHDRLIKKLDVSGTYAFDLLSGETWRLTMIANTAFSIGTKPPANFTKTVTSQMDGNFAPTWSAEISQYKTGSYDGTKLNTLVIEYVEGTMTKFQITQND